MFSPTSVTVVCQYCQSTLLLQSQGLSASGRHSAVLEDYTALQVGSVGILNKRYFQIIGRLQVRYEIYRVYDALALPSIGTWNEWYVQFDSGKTAWLSESNGHFVYTEDMGLFIDEALPIFDVMQAGVTPIEYQGQDFLVSDVRTAVRVKNQAQGELPFSLVDDEEVKLVDARLGNQFITLDFGASDSEPKIFAGFGVSLDELKLRNLRSKQEVQGRAGNLNGSISKSECPHCGGAVRWLPNMATHVNCSYCGAQIDFVDDKANLIRVNDMRAAQDRFMALKIGQVARINQKKWIVLGMICQTEIREDDAFDIVLRGRRRNYIAPVAGLWYEFMLYSYPDEFMWLVQTDDNQWSVSNTLNMWPRLNANLQPVDKNNKPLNKLYGYGGQVQFAVGAFYWPVSPNDVTLYADYGSEIQKLGSEITASEMVWNQAKKVSKSEVEEWFNLQGKLKSQPKGEEGFESGEYPKNATMVAWVLTVVFILINLSAFLGDDSTDGGVIMNLIALYIITLPLHSNDEED